MPIHPIHKVYLDVSCFQYISHLLDKPLPLLSLNSQYPNFRFTHEVEENNSLAFLNVLVIHSGNGFATNLYRKKTSTGLYTNFESLPPSKYKVNLVTVLVYRAFHICSSYAHFHDQLCNIKRSLQQNCFPKHLIDKIIKKFLDG